MYISPNDKEKICDHIKQIDSYNFTPREIDIIAVAIHNKAEKQIAFILDISPRTVSVHIRNILSKIGANSKNALISFIEKSGKLELIRQYYIYLLIENNFKNNLHKIFVNSDIKNLHYILSGFLENIREEETILIKNLTAHLSEVKVKLLVSTNHNISPETYSYDIYSYDTYLNYDLFNNEKDYYLTIIKFCTNLINNERAKNILEEFVTANNALTQSLKQISEKKIDIERIDQAKHKIIRHKYKIMGFILLIFFLITFYLWNEYKNRELISLLDAFLSSNTGSIVDTNIPKEQRQRNYDLSKKIEKILLSANPNIRKKYFKDEYMSSEKILIYAYNLHALASYYMYHEHNGIKAREILLHAKQIIYDYLNRKNVVSLDFDKLKIEEIYSELSLIKDFPEMYTRILYGLGRTYIYQGNPEEGRIYYEYSSYLGEKLNLFEGYLAIISGLCILDYDIIIEHLKNTQNQEAKKLLLDLIAKYESLKQDNKEYKISYIPRIEEHKKIIPGNDIFNISRCNIRLITLYVKLIPLESDIKKKNDLIDKLIVTFIQLSKNFIIDSKIDDNVITPREIARIYNIFGEILLNFQDDNSVRVKLIDQLIPVFLSKEARTDNYFKIIESLFQKACDISSNNDFTKEDGYKGLIKVKKNLLEKKLVDAQTEIQIKQEIKDLEYKKDKIHKALKRR